MLVLILNIIGTLSRFDTFEGPTSIDLGNLFLVDAAS